MSKWIRKGDRVLVIAGNDKGKNGQVLARRGDRVLVQGVNVRIKHMKPTQPGATGRVEREMPIHISNVSLCTTEGVKLKLYVRQTSSGAALFYRQGETETLYRQVKEGRK